MNTQNKKNFKKKKNEPKQKRTNFQKGFEKQHGKGQKQFHKKNFKYEKSSNDYVYQRKQDEDKILVYKQDLLQVGFQIADGESASKYESVMKEYADLFNLEKRKVILPKEHFEQKSCATLNIEEIKEDFEKLIENEDIPDWYIHEDEENQELFDFGNTIEKTKFFQKELFSGETPIQQESKYFQINGFPLEESTEKNEQNLQEMNFDQLDKYLEEKAQKKNEEIIDYSSESEEIKEDSSPENSKNYFNNLEENIKNMLLNSSKDDFEDDSEESFQEALGFNYSGVRNMNPKLAPKPEMQEIIKQKAQESEQIQNVQKEEIKKLESKELEKEDKKEESNSEKKEEQKEEMTQEEIERRKQIFIEKYGYLDPLLNQVVYEILHSKQRNLLNKFSANGFNQKSVEKYCSNQYKIFSMYTQGNIIPKVWLYKDKSGIVQGPFMSYDMDLWNGEKDYFSESVEISLLNSPFLPITKYLNREQEVIEIVEDFLFKFNLKSKEMQTKKKNKNQNQRKKKFTKKNISTIENKDDMNEHFPSLDGQKNEKEIEKYEDKNDDIDELQVKKEFQEISYDHREKSQKQENEKKVKENQEAPEVKDVKEIKQPMSEIKKKEDKRNFQKKPLEDQEYQKKESPAKSKTVFKNEELTNNLMNMLGLQFN